MSINHAEQVRTGEIQPTFWAAPEIAKAGYKVFPVKDKEPTVAGSFYAATDDISEIAAWIEDGHGHHDVAIATGVFGRVVAIDADTPEKFEEMKAKYGPPTYTTKRGGHWLFLHPRNGKVISSKIAPGLDRKGDGGIAVVPPSKGREWTNGIPRVKDLPVLPEEFWSKTKGPTPGERTMGQERKDAAAEVIAKHVGALEPNASGGGRHEHLTHLCGVMLGRNVSLVDAEDILKAAWGAVDEELSERAEREVPNTLATTQQAIAEDRATGVPSMEKITPGLFAELKEIFGWEVQITVGDTHSKPQGEVRYRYRSLSSTGVSNEPEESIQAISFSGREKPGPRGWIVENSIWEGHAASWFGEGGVAKSMLAMHLALTVAAEGKDYWMGFQVKTVPVLYLDFELDADEQHRRALDLAVGMGLSDIPENFYYLSAAMLPPAEAFGLAAEECRRLGVKLIIVDSVGFALDGDSESARDVLGFYRARIQPLKDAGASPLLIDHQAKIIKGEKYSDKQAFGSVYKTNAVRSAFQIRGHHEQSEITATFTHKKNNFGWKEKDFSVKLAFAVGRVTVNRLEAPRPNPDREPSKKELVQKAVEEMGRATTETVQTKTGLNLQTVRNAVSELIREGALKDTGDKQGQHRIVATHSHTTKGTVTVTKAQADTSALQYEYEDRDSPPACDVEEFPGDGE
jgi:hypothetical protein